jgi:hypothetical protein
MTSQIYPCKRRSYSLHKTEALRLFHVDLIMKALKKVQRENGDESLEFRTFSVDFIGFEREIP